MGSTLRATSTRSNPSAANRSANNDPNPLEAPVIRAVRRVVTVRVGRVPGVLMWARPPR